MALNQLSFLTMRNELGVAKSLRNKRVLYAVKLSK